MNLFALLGALILTHYQPHAKGDWLQQLFAPYAHLLEQSFNGGKNKHGVIAWALGALLPAIAVGVAYYFLLKTYVLLGFLFSLCVLYLTLDFGQFGHLGNQIVAALRSGDINLAREIYLNRQSAEADDSSATSIARKGIELTLAHAHHNLFAPIFWLAALGLIGLGPAGAVLYRLSHLLKLAWHPQQDNLFNKFSNQAFEWLDWLPARITAGGFAVVGDFEDAIFCWRTQAGAWSDKSLGIVLASGAGALGVKLGEPLPTQDVIQLRPELGLGDQADADYLQSATGLVWRVLILMIGLLLLLTFAHWLGASN
jgi:adenosylcobinamide-phosphate synthase